jgi:hypothetical protein
VERAPERETEDGEEEEEEEAFTDVTGWLTRSSPSDAIIEKWGRKNTLGEVGAPLSGGVFFFSFSFFLSSCSSVCVCVRFLSLSFLPQ